MLRNHSTYSGGLDIVQLIKLLEVVTHRLKSIGPLEIRAGPQKNKFGWKANGLANVTSVPAPKPQGLTGVGDRFDNRVAFGFDGLHM